MKRRINLLTILTIAALIFTSAEDIYDAYRELKSIFVSAKVSSNNEEDLTLLTNINAVQLTPNLINKDSSSSLKTKDGSKVASWTHEAYISIQTETSVFEKIILFVGGTISFIGTILCIIYFLKFIININQEKVFHWKNVSLLKKLGAILILIYLMEFLCNYISTISVARAVDLKYYSFDYITTVGGTNLLLGIITLLISGVFAKGLKIKEEQDLTI